MIQSSFLQHLQLFFLSLFLRFLSPSSSRHNDRGIRTLAVAKTDSGGTWKMLGMLTFLDPPRPDTKQTIEEAREYGVSVKMITGDHLLIARETAR